MSRGEVTPWTTDFEINEIEMQEGDLARDLLEQVVFAAKETPDVDDAWVLSVVGDTGVAKQLMTRPPVKDEHLADFRARSIEEVLARRGIVASLQHIS